MRRLAARVPSIDIFGHGHVLRDDEGWEITPAGRDFLAMLEAVTQDNLGPVPAPQKDKAGATAADGGGDLIVIGEHFKNRVHRLDPPLRKEHCGAGIRCGESASS